MATTLVANSEKAARVSHSDGKITLILQFADLLTPASLIILTKEEAKLLATMIRDEAKMI